MHHEAVNELRAFEIATQAAREREWPWRPPYWIGFEDGAWEVGAASDPEEVVIVDPASGEILFSDPPLDPLRALTIARDYATAQGLPWKPSFSLGVERGYWRIESCGNQMGGNVYIHVGHDGRVIEHWINAK